MAFRIVYLYLMRLLDLAVYPSIVLLASDHRLARYVRR